MRRWLLIGSLVFAGAVGLLAQATPKIYWDHDGVDVTRFECVVDGGAPSNLGLPAKSGTTYSTDITNCPGVMVNGQHSLVIQACNANGCTAATAITVVKL